jgi:hypothetical protein
LFERHEQSCGAPPRSPRANEQALPGSSSASKCK